jgi:pSer/pThr/pTyr-binding forkhead associated (FHA) protein
MSARLLARTSDGMLQEFPLAGPLRIGSDAPSEVRIAAAGVLPEHARTGADDNGVFIEAIGVARLAINGELVERRTLRHLDVITLGDTTHVIFSTSAAPLPMQTRPRPAAAAAAPAASAPAPNATREFSRGDLAAVFKPIADAPADATPKTSFGVPPAASFKPDAAATPNTSTGLPPPAPFAPAAASPHTRLDLPPATAPPAFEGAPRPTLEIARAVPAFNPQETRILEAPAVRPITGVRLTGTMGAFDAPLGRSLIGRGSTAAVRIQAKEVSREHSVLVVTADRVILEDLNSVNGTTVNGAAVDGSRELAEGDLISFGPIDLRVDFIRLGGG